MTHRLASLAAVACALSFAPAVDAAPKPKIALRLDYEYEPPTPAGDCPDAEELSMALAGEFGYLVVRPDAPSRLRVQIRREGRSYVAEVWGPDTSGREDAWHTQTDKQGSCRELGYDLSSVVKIALGPTAWGSETPPPWLAAPPELEVGTPELHPFALRMPEFLAAPSTETDESGAAESRAEDKGAMHAEAGLVALVAPYGLSSVAVGGGGNFFVRWPKVALGLELRGLITPATGIGEPPIPGRTSIFGGALLPCFTAARVDVCAVATINNLEIAWPANYRPFDTEGLTAGFGARIAGRWQLAARFGFVGFGEATGEIRHVTVRTVPIPGGVDPGSYWRSPTLRLVFGLGVVFSLM